MADKFDHIDFTPEMRDEYTILIPDMLPVHFRLLEKVFIQYGYKIETLKNEGRSVVDAGLQYVHNDTCYPALLTIGQMIDALQSGKYDVHKTALMITQTGGGCRASNYIHLLRKALVKANLEFVPVISLNVSNLEKNSGFKIYPGLLVKGILMCYYGDLMLLLSNQLRPYEVEKGSVQKLVQYWTDELAKQCEKSTASVIPKFKSNMKKIIKSFEGIEVDKTRDILKCGIVGEIYAKYSVVCNNHLAEFLESQNCEVYIPGLMNFLIFKLDNRIEDIGLYGGSKKRLILLKGGKRLFEWIEGIYLKPLQKTGKFFTPITYNELKALTKDVIGYGVKMGEGWLLTGEMVEMIHSSYGNIVCAQPFGCLPNHIVGKGMIRKLRELYPESNIVAIDYDPGATRVNQENRIKLMLSVARERQNKKSSF